MAPAPVGPKALMPNPALQRLAFLIGDWRTVGTHPLMPGQSLPGRTSFSWADGGAFVQMRSEVNAEGFPDGVALIGSDSVTGAFAMIYFDERGVSRLFEVLVGDGTVTWSHENETISQTLTITAEGSDRLVSKGRMSEKGGPWSDDLSQVFTRG